MFHKTIIPTQAPYLTFHLCPVMSLPQESDDHLAARSEHSLRLDEIESYDAERLLCDVDDCSSSAAAFHVFMDDWNDTTRARFVKSPTKPMPNQDRIYSSPRKQAYRLQEQHSIDTLHRSRLIASMLYESLSEMLSSSHRDVGILALDNVARNIGSLAKLGSREAQKEKLANLLTEGMNAYESRRAARLKQKDQLVDVLSDVFSKIEELLAAEGGTSVDKSNGKSCRSDDRKSASSRPSSKRQPSFHSEASSITSRTSGSLHPDSPRFENCAVYRLPAELKAQPKSVAAPPMQTASTKELAAKKAKGRSRIALQDSFSSFSSTDTEDAAPKRPQRRGSFRGTNP
jgi:hypothetical protein